VRTAWAKANLVYAETLGSAFPSLPFKGIVHSVFPHAVNIQEIDKRIMCTVLVDKDAQYPRSVVLHKIGEHSMDFIAMGLQAGQTVTADSAGLMFDCGLWVSFLGATRTHGDQEHPPKNMAKDLNLVNTAIKYLVLLQNTMQTELQWEHLVTSNPTDSPFSQRFFKCAWELKNSFIDGLLENSITSGKLLLGLGPGLTPAGDDFLCGFALAAYSRSSLQPNSSDYIEKQSVHTWLAHVLDWTASATPPTNSISLNFLTLAAAGKFSCSLVRLASAFDITTENPELSLREALQSLSHYGHSSGLDAVTGFLFGLSKEIPKPA